MDIVLEFYERLRLGLGYGELWLAFDDGGDIKLRWDPNDAIYCEGTIDRAGLNQAVADGRLDEVIAMIAEDFFADTQKHAAQN